MHISKRDTISRGKAWTIRAIAILLALIVDGIQWGTKPDPFGWTCKV